MIVVDRIREQREKEDSDQQSSIRSIVPTRFRSTGEEGRKGEGLDEDA